MRALVERLVEDYNEVREALARTRVEQARTRRQVLEACLAAQRRYHQRLTRQVRRAVAQERRRQEILRRRALLRRLAAARAAAARAAGRAGPGAGPAPPSGAAARAVGFARSQLGKPYVWGASGPARTTAPAWS
jgi:peptidoglycan DL-endopeptidase CwlO